ERAGLRVVGHLHDVVEELRLGAAAAHMEHFDQAVMGPGDRFVPLDSLEFALERPSALEAGAVDDFHGTKRLEHVSRQPNLAVAARADFAEQLMIGNPGLRVRHSANSLLHIVCTGRREKANHKVRLRRVEKQTHLSLALNCRLAESASHLWPSARSSRASPVKTAPIWRSCSCRRATRFTASSAGRARSTPAGSTISTPTLTKAARG